MPAEGSPGPRRPRAQTISLLRSRPCLQFGRVRAAEKIISLAELPHWRDEQRAAGRTVVVTNGCFDLLHAGHVTYLEAAAGHGDLLLVGVNDDAGVRELKGPTRPVNPEGDRALVLAALASVGAVSIFHGATATAFLRAARPDVYVKGGDYRVETLNPEERRVVESGGGRFVFIPFLEGRSTTSVIGRMTR
jgi:rfaE bifunctional protein nucleotidyltransferase chain/domain